MNTLIITAFITFLLFQGTASGQNWMWAKQESSAHFEFAGNCSADEQANTFAILHYTKPIRVGENLFSPCASPSSLLIKYNAEGRVFWARRVCAKVNDVHADESGNCILTGRIPSPADFEGGTGNSEGSQEAGATWNTYLAKFSRDGNLIWVKFYEHQSGEGGIQVKTDRENNIYLLMKVNSTIDSRSIIAKYDPEGNLLWDLRSNRFQVVDQMDLDAGSNIYIAGNSFVTLLGELGHENESSTPPEYFLGKINPDGKLLWVKNYPGNASFSGLRVSAKGFLYLTAAIGHQASFGSQPITGPRSCIARFDTSAKFNWVRPVNGAFGMRLEIDESENLYCTGNFSDSVYFPESIFEFTSAGTSAFFIAKLRADGAIEWASPSEGSSGGYALIQDITKDPFSNFIITGTFAEKLNFGSNTLLCEDTNTFKGDFFIAEFGQLTASLSHSNWDMALKIIPNPSQGKFLLELEEEMNRAAMVRIYDLVGNCIHTQQLGNERTAIDLTGTASGIYFMEVRCGNRMINKKIILGE